MRLVDWIQRAPHKMAAPLAGYPGMALTDSTMKQNEFNAELQARTLYKIVEQTRCDAVFTLMDLSVEGGALGLPVKFPLSDSATVEWHPVKKVGDLEQYKVVDPLYDARVWAYLEAVRILKRKVDVPIGAYVIAPFTLAGLLMGANDIAVATVDKPAVVKATVNFTEGVIVSYARALTEAGADMICILDPTSVMLSPDSFREFCAPSLRNVVRHVAAPVVLHICGNTSHLVEPMCDTRIQGLSLDSLVPMPDIASRVPSNIAIIGNLDPTQEILRGTPADVKATTTEMLKSMRGYDNFIPSTGCDLPAATPMENICAFVDTVHEWR